MFHISADQAMANFFFWYNVGYNFVKYDALARAKKQMRNELKIIAVLSLFSSIGVGYYFFNCS
jgi:hypothetical protein